MAKPTSPIALLLFLLLLLLLFLASTQQVVVHPPSASQPSVPPQHRKLEGRLAKLFNGDLDHAKFFNITIGSGRSGEESSAQAPTAAPPPQRARRSQSYKYLQITLEFLKAHNRVREAEGEVPLAWDEKLARHANRWALRQRDVCANKHSNSAYGENMFTGTDQGWTARQAVEIWAAEAEHYDRESNTCEEGEMCGHYTQIVWNSTQRVGCARVRCFAGGIIITCNYDPPGNFVDESPFTCI